MADADELLLLEVVVNGHSTGKIGEFTLRDGALFARRDELQDVGFRVPDSAAATPDKLIPLASLPGVTVRLDQATQTLQVTAANNRLLPALLRAAGTAAGGRVQSGTGGTLNYDITGTSVSGQNVGAGLFDLRAFSPWGVASSGMLGYLGSSPSGPGTNSSIRLDTVYVYSDPDSLRRYRLGDFISGGLSWTRPVRLGGAQINSDFSLRPDLVTFPLPSVSGAVTVPSTVDVLVNNTQLLSRQVQPGPFQVTQLPVVTGAGTVALTTTDAVGRQVTTTLPFYASSDLLAPGLQSYSVEAGVVRQNWGVVSNDYGQPAAFGTYRRGLSDDITMEAHAEGGSAVFMGGGGLVVNVANLAVANLAVAGSSGAGRGGAQVAAGIQRISPTFSFGISATADSRAFRDVASEYGNPAPRLQLNANAGLSLGRFGSIGAAYTAVDRDAASAPINFFVAPGTNIPQSASIAGGVISRNGTIASFTPAQHSHILSASYSVQLGAVSLYATGLHDFANSQSTSILFGLTVPLGVRSSANINAGSTSGSSFAQAQVVQSAVSVGDWGYQAFAAAANPDHEFAQLQYKSSWALLSAGADRIDHQTSFRTEAQGALSFTDGSLFASNTINDSFAVVDTEGTPGIRVLDENRAVGQTDASGRLLVPDLRSFDLNRISIEPTDVPMDATVPSTEQEVRPQDRSGVVVRFPVHVSHGALLRLVDEAGTPLPVGSVATLRSNNSTWPVGYDGEAYIEDLGPSNQLGLQLPGGRRCSVSFTYHPVVGEIPTLGPFKCLGR